MKHSHTLRYALLCGSFLMLAAPQAAYAVSTTERITELRTLALEGNQEEFSRKLEAATDKNKIDLLVELGKLHENLPNALGLNQPHYTDAANFYRQALTLAEEEKIENEWVQRARLYYARLLLDGRGGEHDVPKAVALLKQASDKGNSAAAYSYAMMLERGYGDIAPDAVNAEIWYRTSIRQGEGRAAFALANLIETGQVKSTKDAAAAAQEMRKLGMSLLKVAARKGESSAAAALGRMYERGEGAPKNEGEAIRWYELGAKAGSIKSMLGAGYLIGRGEGMKKAAAKEKATDYMRMAAKAGSAKAALELGTFLLYPENYFLTLKKEEAEQWLEAAASSGNTQAIQRLTDYYLGTGQGYKVLDRLVAGAEEGRVAPMLALYRMYRDGSGVSVDKEKANAYLERASQSENIEPQQYYLLSQYYQEQGKDEEAFEFLHKAANTNLLAAQIALAEAYDAGAFGKEDEAEALRWYERAALRGSIRGMLRAGWYYSGEHDLPEDKAKAATYLDMAVKKVGKDDYSGMTEIGIAYLKGRGFARSGDEALKWMEQGAKGNDPRALLQLSRMIRYGAVEGRKREESITLLKQAADLGYANAIQELGQLYATGMLVPVDATQAFAYFSKAAALGKDESMRQIGLAYINGYGVEQNIEEGIRYLKRAAAMNYGTAMLNLALLYRYPPAGMEADSAAYFEWLKEAAKHHQADAEYLLGMAYLNGDGITQDAETGKKLIKKAAGQKHFAAKQVALVLDGGARH